MPVSPHASHGGNIVGWAHARRAVDRSRDRSTCADADARAAAAKVPGSPLIVELDPANRPCRYSIEDVDSGGYVSFSCGEEAFRQIERDADAATLITMNWCPTAWRIVLSWRRRSIRRQTSRARLVHAGDLLREIDASRRWTLCLFQERSSRTRIVDHDTATSSEESPRGGSRSPGEITRKNGATGSAELAQLAQRVLRPFKIPVRAPPSVVGRKPDR